MSTLSTKELLARVAAHELKEREEAQELSDKWETVEPGIYRYVGSRTPMTLS